MRQLLAQRTSWNALCEHCTLSIPTEKGKILPMSKISGHIHCETFESSFLKLFHYLYPEWFWDSSKSIFYFIASTNASLVSSYCLCRGLFIWAFFLWILLQFKALFWQLSRRKSLPINLIIIRGWLKKRRLWGGRMVLTPPSVHTCNLNPPSPPPPPPLPILKLH